MVGEVAIPYLAPMSPLPLTLLMAQGWKGGLGQKEGAPWEGAPPLLISELPLAAGARWCPCPPQNLSVVISEWPL